MTRAPRTLAAVVLVLALACIAHGEETPRYAYALIHYEGTDLDEEYLLGARVLIQSIVLSRPKHSTHEVDIVVVVSDNVCAETRRVLSDAGAIVRVVPDIPNPYKDRNVAADGAVDAGEAASFKSHFEHSLNKLWLWNLTEYERIIYMDEDDICLRDMDELFRCGHFCAVFQNPVNFHTGMIVLKPDRAVFQDMLQQMANGMASYDGGDQGFFVSYFSKLSSAPLFDADTGETYEVPMMRLPIPYSLNHIYYYEKFNWKLYRSPAFPHLRTAAVPAFSMTYPIAQPFKPWNWVPYWFLDVHWVWFSLRLTLKEDLWFGSMARLAVALGAGSGVYLLVIQKLLPTYGVRISGALSGPRDAALRVLGPRYTSILLGLPVSLFIMFKAAPLLIPNTTFPVTAWTTWVILDSCYSYYAVDIFARCLSSNRSAFPIAQAATPAVLTVLFLAVAMNVRFPEFLSKLAFTIVMLVLILVRKCQMWYQVLEPTAATPVTPLLTPP